MSIKGYEIPAIMFLLWPFLFFSFALAIYSQDWISVFIGGSAIALSAYLVFLQKNSDIHIPRFLFSAILLFLYATLFLGELQDFYEKYWWWDVVLHTGSAVCLGMLGVITLAVILKKERARTSPFIISLFAFSAALAVGALWEIFEFAGDQILGTNMQKSGLQDTMWDLIVDAIGAATAGIVGYFYFSGKRYKDPISSAIEEGVQENS